MAKPFNTTPNWFRRRALQGLFLVALSGVWFAGHRFINTERFDGPGPVDVHMRHGDTAVPPAPPPEPAPEAGAEPAANMAEIKAAAAVLLDRIALAQQRIAQARSQPPIPAPPPTPETESNTPLSAQERAEVLHTVSVRLQLAFLLFEQKKLDRCADLCREILRVDPNYPIARQLKRSARRLRFRPSEHESVARTIAGWRVMQRADAGAAIPLQSTFQFPSRERWEHIVRVTFPDEGPDQLELYNVRDLAGVDGSGGDALAETIKIAVDPLGWREARSLVFHRGALIALTRPVVHEKIQGYLEARRAGANHE